MFSFCNYLITLSLILLPQAVIGKTVENNIFRVSVFPATEFDPASIKTAGQFIVLHQLIRPLTKLDKVGQIEGDLVESWRIKDDFKSFIFKIKADAKWSDGSAIRSIDVKDSLQRQLRLNTSNHFNFNIIENIAVINELEFSIKLKSSNSLFIRQVSYPEFGIVKIKDDAPDLTVTSGAYFLSKKDDKEILIEKNHYYKDFSTKAPKSVIFENIKPEQLHDSKEEKKFDFVIPYASDEKEIDSYIKRTSSDLTEPHIGYSYWLSINPKSTLLDTIEKKHTIQALINEGIEGKVKSFEYLWKPAKQLYLPDGLGRPADKDLNLIWQEITANVNIDTLKGKEIKILTRPNFIFNEAIIQTLKRANIHPKISTVTTFQELDEKRKEEEFDLILLSNDFSSIDLHENLQTTFNPLHPLIQTDKEDLQFQEHLKKALNAGDGSQRQEIYKEIAKKILAKGYIIPIAYQKLVFLHRKDIDISSWSTLFPEISLWKINIKK